MDVATSPGCDSPASRLSAAGARSGGEPLTPISLSRVRTRCAQIALREEAVLQTPSDTLVSFVVAVIALAGILLILVHSRRSLVSCSTGSFERADERERSFIR